MSTNGFNQSFNPLLPTLQNGSGDPILTSLNDFNHSFNRNSASVPGVQENPVPTSLAVKVDHAERGIVVEGEVAGYDPYSRGGGVSPALNNVDVDPSVSLDRDGHVVTTHTFGGFQDSISQGEINNQMASFLFDDGVVEAADIVDNNEV